MARNWLEAFGFEYSEVRKGMYMNGHEYADVIAYCERFLERMAEYETHMIVFSGENMEKETQPAFQDIIPKGEQPLRKKDQGWSVHVSEFLTDVDGHLIAFPNLPSEACVITYPGKNGTKALFVFDNATRHCAYSEDALVAKNMNLSSGGKQPKMRSTIYRDNIPQEMCFPKDYDDPDLCSCEEGRIDCCAKTTMANQSDFRAQCRKLEEAIILISYKVIFYPKFYCELNYIENFWELAKQYAQCYCNYTWEGLKKTVLQALESVSFTEIRQYAQKAFRFMDVYRKGLTGKVAEYAVKKYYSHSMFQI
ncbi:4208_t:CDS:2 [Cetraspora pellucida]|uniref:4208_t:CDS:1 n=1 Tax=Cetraspora pellucida TaxID=1433469 RepID=A0A9N9EKP8_9GLOM|nr:4208_t:CDS:2 [Cetraspora pellucida]